MGGPRRRQKNLSRGAGHRQGQRLLPHGAALPSLTCVLPARRYTYMCTPTQQHHPCSCRPHTSSESWTQRPPIPFPTEALFWGPTSPNSHSASPAREGHLSEGPQPHWIPESHEGRQWLCQEAQLSCQDSPCLGPRRQLLSQGALTLGWGWSSRRHRVRRRGYLERGSWQDLN